LNTLFFGKKCIELDVVDSTNNYAANLISTTNVLEGTVIMAHYQTKGKGQMGNVWHAEPSKNLTFSIVLRPKFLNHTTSFLLSKIVALAVKEVIDNICIPQESIIKWPNDILINSKKIAGILIENHWHLNELTSIVGIGINVNQSYFEKELNATSCLMQSKKELSVSFVMEKVIKQLESEYLKLRSGAIDDVNQRYLEHLLYFKQSKPYKIGTEIIQGTIENVENDGKITLRLTNNSIRKFSFKEIGFLING